MVSEKQDRSGIYKFLRCLTRSFAVLKKRDPIRLAGATAFFSSFALPPILLLIGQVFSIFLSRKLVGTQIVAMLSKTLGRQGAEQVRQTTRGFRTLAQNWYTGLIGFLFLAFVATTLFAVIRNSIHDIWSIKTKEKSGMLFHLKIRGRSLAVIFLAGILFFCGVLLDSFQLFAGNYIGEIWKTGGMFFKSALNEILAIIVMTLWFVVLFRYLADARPSWKVCIVGGLVTGTLFSFGKAALSYAVVNSNVRVIYGPGGALALLLLFVFYSAFILYYGAAFVKVYAASIGHPIVPVHNAYRYEIRKVMEKA